MEIIAEIGQNHNGDMGLARELICAAKENGADAVKFQVYDARALFPQENNPWYDYNLSTELTRKDILNLAEFCSEQKIEFFASVFDTQRITWLEEIHVKRYKVASRSIHDSGLIDALNSTGKQLLVSLGMWEHEDFPDIQSPNEVSYLYCISQYPTPLDKIKLNHVDFNKYAGFSDHSIGISAAMAAFARGAKIIEKHFTLDKNMYGPDHSCSMTPSELARLNLFRNDLKQLL